MPSHLGQHLFNWYFNRTTKDPVARISFPQSSADPHNTLYDSPWKEAIGQSGKAW